MNNDSFTESIVWCFSVVLWLAAGYGVCILFGWEPWNKNNKDLTENWIVADNELGDYRVGLDDDWAVSSLDSLKIEGKLRKPLNNGDNRYDFICKVKSTLTPPELASDAKNKIIKSYEFEIEYRFIDEDGFIIYTLERNWYGSFIEHEKYKRRITWTLEEYPFEKISVVFARLYEHIIPEGIAKRVRKITAVPRLNAKIEEVKFPPSFKPIGEEPKKPKMPPGFKPIQEEEEGISATESEPSWDQFLTSKEYDKLADYRIYHKPLKE